MSAAEPARLEKDGAFHHERVAQEIEDADVEKLPDEESGAGGNRDPRRRDLRRQ